jgi:signal transduction histidine kinase
MNHASEWLHSRWVGTAPAETDDVSLMLSRPLQLAVVGFLTIVVATVLVVGLLTWRNERRLVDLQVHISGMQQVQTEFLELERKALGPTGEDGKLSAATRADLRRELERLAQDEVRIGPESHARLAEAQRLLAESDFQSLADSKRLRELFRSIALSEGHARQAILEAITHDMQIELRLALAVPFVLMCLGAAILWGARRRIYQPLRGLEFLLSEVAAGKLSTIPVDDIDPILLPLFHNYNDLVSRLRELEDAHRSHAASLEREVRVVTGALLEQQQSLARAERLAATGELAASVAHELRNPLAAIQMALRNLRSEIGEPELQHRLSLVGGEVERLSRLLNEMLTFSKHEPEPVQPLRLADLVRQLVELTRYQLPRETSVEVEVAEELVCQLPGDSLRQALLNLILNAAQALPDGRGSIVVRVTHDGDGLVLTVEDDGPGFDETTLAQVARPFFSTRSRGTGLGLAIVYQFARESGGSLELSNRDAGGARVTLALPCEVSRE